MLLDPHAFLFWGSASGCSLLITKTFPIVMVLRVSLTVRMFSHLCVTVHCFSCPPWLSMSLFAVMMDSQHTEGCLAVTNHRKKE